MGSRSEKPRHIASAYLHRYIAHDLGDRRGPRAAGILEADSLSQPGQEAAVHAMKNSRKLPLQRFTRFAGVLALVVCAVPRAGAATSWAKDPADFPSSPLCKPAEVTLWTCAAQHKTFSLCAQRDAPMDQVAIQYRVQDRSGRTLLRYPEPSRAPRSAFAYMCSANGDAEVEFKIGQYTYSLVDPLRDVSFISVRKGQRELAHLTCHEGNQSLQLNATMALMQALKVPQPN